ncbi:MAG: ATP-binding protein [Clostridia bacterium]|nr:ATP-binding protein [Clostridia bacterium]
MRETERIVRKAYYRVLPVQIISTLVLAVNAFIDNVITGNMLGDEAVAAIGFFGPVAAIIGVSYVVVLGIQILIGNYIGQGSKEQIVSLFSTGIIFLAGFCSLLTVLCLVFHAPLSLILGARGNAAVLLGRYIIGYSFGIPGEVLAGTLMCFLPLNNDARRSYLGLGVMIGTNILLDILFTAFLKLGIFGIGLASSISSLSSFAVMFPGVLNRQKAIYFRPGKTCFSTLPEAVRLGLPSLMFTLGCTAKSYIMNMTLMNSVGTAAVAAMNVQGNLCAFLGAFPQGIGNAYLSLAGIYYSEEDRTSLTSLMRIAMRSGILLSAGVMTALMASSHVLPGLFFANGSEAWLLTSRMLLLFPCFLVLNTVLNLFLKAYQCQDRMTLVNVMSVAESLIMAILAVGSAPLLGADAVWLSFPFGEIICLAIIAISVWLFSGRITFALTDWMKLDRTFGAGAVETFECSVHSMADVVHLSEKIIHFCSGHQIDRRTSYIVGLAIEEMAGNVIQHGFIPGRRHSVDIRIIKKDDLTIRIRDDCPAFDLEHQLSQFQAGDDVTKNVGIRMISAMADLNYQSTAGINTLLIRIRHNPDNVEI